MKRIIAAFAISVLVFGSGISADKINSNNFISPVPVTAYAEDYDEYDYYDDYDNYYEHGYNAEVRSTDEPVSPVIRFFVSVVAGVIIAAVSVNSMKSKLKTVRRQRGAADYQKQGSFRLRTRRDTFLYKRVEKTPIANNQQENNPNGRR